MIKLLSKIGDCSTRLRQCNVCRVAKKKKTTALSVIFTQALEKIDNLIERLT